MPEYSSERAGSYFGDKARGAPFNPKPLRAGLLHLDETLVSLLSSADLAVGRLSGVSSASSGGANRHLGLLGLAEAYWSSEFEKPGSSFEQVLLRSVRGERMEWLERFRSAQARGIEHSRDEGFSVSLLHQLAADVSGVSDGSGVLREEVIWLGPEGLPIEQAEFVPPHPAELGRVLNQLELYVREDRDTPVLLKAALCQYQLDTIHPYPLRTGLLSRILPQLVLAERQVIDGPALTLSEYFLRHRRRYYDSLHRVRSGGDYEGWVKFFLKGVLEVAESRLAGLDRADEVLREDIERADVMVRGPHGTELVDLLVEVPAVNVELVAQRLEVTFPTANALIRRLEKSGVIEEVTGRKRGRVFFYRRYVEALLPELVDEV